MGLFDQIRLATRDKRKLKRTIKIIQASHPEGLAGNVILESMLTGQRVGTSVPGTINAFATYDSQVSETYRKYNAETDFGNQQTRAIVDLRTAFIAGEGLTVSADNEATAKWIEQFINFNRLSDTSFVNAVKGSEMSGQSLFVLKGSEWIDDTFFIKAMRIPYSTKRPFRPRFTDNIFKDTVKDIQIKNREGSWVSLGLSNFVYIRTGGDDVNEHGPTTKVGTVLTDIENYDRAIRDMRRNNHIFARITPNWKTKTDTETSSLEKSIADKHWKIGEAVIGQAEFQYVTPGQGAHQNLNTELVATIKTISSVTGIPVHWLGYVDLMSNRSTADSLYELIKNGTINERTEWEKAFYDMIVKAQNMYIDLGGLGLPRLDFDFQVHLPLIDFSNFLERVRALSLALGDRAISMDDYRGALPGIDPLKTERAIAIEDKEDEQRLLTTTTVSSDDSDDDTEDD